MWHSLVVRSVRDRKVASSNLVTSTTGGKTPPFLLENGYCRFLLFLAGFTAFRESRLSRFNRIKLKGNFAPFFCDLESPQNPDFAESEGSGGKAKKQTVFVLSKQPTSRAGDAREYSLFRRYAPYKSCHGGKTLPIICENAMGVFLLYGRFFLFRKKSRKLNFLRGARYRSQN